MSVYNRILDWSKDRPCWQRDALRRLMYKESLDASDISTLADICECEFDVRHDDPQFEPLTSADLPVAREGHGTVTLRGLEQIRNIDLLADGIEFAPTGLTVIHGPNGCGKSGYSRILRTLCRARGSEPELQPSVLDHGAGDPGVTVRYEVAGADYRFAWDESAEPPDALRQVSVFDANAAEVYVGGKSPAAYRPAGLDVLTRLGAVCDDVRRELERRSKAVTEQTAALPKVPEGTKAEAFLDDLSAKTKLVDIEAACTVSEDLDARIGEVTARLAALEPKESSAKAAALREKSQRLTTLAKQLRALQEVLSDAAMNELREAKSAAVDFGEAARAAATSRFSDHPVQPVGTRLWSAMIESAMAYFEEASTGTFPGDDRCMLCQTPLTTESKGRLEDFRRFLEMQAKGRAEDADRQLTTLTTRLDELDFSAQFFSLMTDELASTRPELSQAMKEYLDRASSRRDALLGAVESDDWSVDSIPPAPVDALTEFADEIAAESATLSVPPDPEVKRRLQAELAELKGTEALANSVDAIKAHHKALVKQKRYDKCIRSAKTTTVSRESGKMLTEAVTDRLTAAFEEECRRLSPTPYPVTLGKGGTRKGEVLHNVTIDEAPPKTSPSEIASSGESRLLAIAGFFAELATAEAPSAVIFDDPSTNLDAPNVDRLARRLAEEAALRQVIVFTHDDRFVEGLRDRCEANGAAQSFKELRRDGARTGVSSATPVAGTDTQVTVS